MQRSVRLRKKGQAVMKSMGQGDAAPAFPDAANLTCQPQNGITYFFE